MNVNQAGLEIIKEFEGFSPTPYQCPAGVWSIGYGSTRDLGGNRVTEDTPSVTWEQADDLLAAGLEDAVNAVGWLVKAPLTINQFSALVSFTYNLGGGNLQASTLLRKLNRGDEADSEFNRWVYAGGRKLQGLVFRREIERQLFMEG